MTACTADAGSRVLQHTILAVPGAVKLMSEAKPVQVLRFANLVFEPLWSRNYIRNVQVSRLTCQPACA